MCPGWGLEVLPAQTKLSFISHRNGDLAATPAFVGRIDERANITQKLQSAKESVYLPHKVRVAYRRDNFKLRSRQIYKAVGTAPTALVFLSHSLYFTSKSITTSH